MQASPTFYIGSFRTSGTYNLKDDWASRTVLLPLPCPRSGELRILLAGFLDNLPIYFSVPQFDSLKSIHKERSEAGQYWRLWLSVSVIESSFLSHGGTGTTPFLCMTFYSCPVKLIEKVIVSLISNLAPNMTFFLHFLIVSLPHCHISDGFEKVQVLDWWKTRSSEKNDITCHN